MATRDENKLLLGKVEMLETDIKSTKEENTEDKRRLQDQLTKTISDASGTEMLLRKKLELETSKVQNIEDKYRKENTDREKSQALSEQ